MKRALALIAGAALLALGVWSAVALGAGNDQRETSSAVTTTTTPTTGETDTTTGETKARPTPPPMRPPAGQTPPAARQRRPRTRQPPPPTRQTRRRQRHRRFGCATTQAHGDTPTTSFTSRRTPCTRISEPATCCPVRTTRARQPDPLKERPTATERTTERDRAAIETTARLPRRTTTSGPTRSVSRALAGGRRLAQGPLARPCLVRAERYSSNRVNTTQALCPPKPKLFETATFTSASRASFGT